ncbi:MAG TPA: Na+/H+ antiporter [Myxococcales bacterium]|nr:Na+/H+ antiporter [Myxococcales bacterium]
MAALQLILLLLAVGAGLRIAAERLKIPYSALLVVGGLALAFFPHLPRPDLSPEVIFIIFTPPLIYRGAASFPLRDLWHQMGPILHLAVLMVLVSTACVAVVAHAVDPAFTWAAAFTLGAIVSSPDPVPVESMMRDLKAPRAVQSLLEGEALLNDATALIVYRLAIAAAVTGEFRLWRATGEFVIAAGGALLIGAAIGAVVIGMHRLTRTVPVVENAVSLLTPYAAWFPAESLGASGVVSVATTGMIVARYFQNVSSPETRLQNAAIWSMVTFLLESLAFVLVGFALPQVIRTGEMATLLEEAGIVCVFLVIIRVAWILPSSWVGRRVERWIRGDEEPLPSWRELLFVAWTGIRGGDAVAIALALPFTVASGAPYPARAQIVFITFAVVLATLVVQGSTLAPVARLLRLREDESEEDEEANARLVVAEAGLRALESPDSGATPHPEIVRYLRLRQMERVRGWAGVEALLRIHDAGGASQDRQVTSPSRDPALLAQDRAAKYRTLRGAMLNAEEKALLDLRDRGVIGDEVMRRILRDLDLERILVDSPEPLSEAQAGIRAEPE